MKYTSSRLAGLGANPFNPALAARAVLQATFPVAMTTWAAPFAAGRFGSVPRSILALPLTQPVYDAVAGATPLSAWKFSHQATGARDWVIRKREATNARSVRVALPAGFSPVTW